MRRRGGLQKRVRALVRFMDCFYQLHSQPSAVATEPELVHDAPLVTGYGGLQALASLSASDQTSLEHLLVQAMRQAASGQAREVLATLDASPTATLVEPLVLALAQRLGQHRDAPTEVREVAQDVLVRIDALAATGDIWRTDVLSLPRTRRRRSRARACLRRSRCPCHPPG